ncbi:MAG: hypothetical protein HY012_01460, partial [Acidobacteria bacterium]|nr:hypothetical protein [Acidobacteriota bacterium]
MFGSAVLDVAIGLVFVYLLLAVFCTAITEAISRRMKLRAVILKEGIDRLLGGIPGASQAIYSHPLIATLARKDEKPSYIAPRAFAVALMDFVGQGQPPGMTSHERFRAAVSSAAGGAATGPQGERELKSALFALAGDPKLAAEAATERLAGWFDESMDRVGGWYKRKIQVITFAVALLVTLAANADTFHILSRLWSDPSLRAVVLAQATERAKKPPRLTIEYPDPDSPIPSAPVDTAAGSSANSSGLTQEDFAAIGQITGWSDLAGTTSVQKEVDLRFQLGNEIWEHTFAVVHSPPYQVLLGMDFLEFNRAEISLGEKRKIEVCEGRSLEARLSQMDFTSVSTSRSETQRSARRYNEEKAEKSTTGKFISGGSSSAEPRALFSALSSRLPCCKQSNSSGHLSNDRRQR